LRDEQRKSGLSLELRNSSHSEVVNWRESLTSAMAGRPLWAEGSLLAQHNAWACFILISVIEPHIAALKVLWKAFGVWMECLKVIRFYKTRYTNLLQSQVPL